MRTQPKILCLSVALAIVILSGPVSRAVEFHVSPQGDDTGPGNEAGPFATLGRAQAAVRAQIQLGLQEDVSVFLRGGIYRLDRTLSFGPQDSGTTRCKVTYAPHPGEVPVVSGGRAITGWKRGSANRWTVHLPAVKAGDWWFRQLYVDGQRLPRGRYPAEGFLKIKDVSKDLKKLTFTTPLPDQDFGGGDTEIVVVQNWSITREIIAASSQSGLTAETALGWVGHNSCRAKPGMSAFFEHALAFVQKPGQWHLARKTGILTYQAAPDENPNERVFVAPVLTQLVQISGTRDYPVQNLHFQGIVFADSAFLLPAIGYNGIQACYYGTTQEEAVCFAVDVALEMAYCRDCSLRGSQFTRLGGSGVGMGPGCRDNQVLGCELSDIGGTGINIGHMKVKNPLWADWTHPAEVPVHNTVANCRIHDCGVELWGAHGIFDAMTRDTRIRHNEIYQMPYGAVATGYVWGTERTSQQGCLIENNHIYEVMHKLNDSGCIYTLGFQPGSIIRGNLLHGVRFGGFAGGQVCNNGIFFDEGSKGFLLEDNVIYDVDQKQGARNTAVRFNRSREDWQIWINNSITTEAAPPDAAKALRGKAGLEPAYAPSEADLAFITGQTQNTLAVAKNPTQIPRRIDAQGELETVGLYSWTSGFFAGNLWYLYELTGDAQWKQEAIRWTEALAPIQHYSGNHDVGFMINCSYGNGLRLAGMEDYESVLIQTAESLCKRYSPITKCIESWDKRDAWDGTHWDYPVIIDNMMNLELLFKASLLSGNARYRDIAVQHALTTIEDHYRPDFSCYHVVDYDPETGKVLDKATCQGFTDESSWARGQAWGLYGFCICYRYTQDPRFLEFAQNIARYMLNHPRLPEDGIPLWDYQAGQAGWTPQWDYDAAHFPVIPRDASAAAITCSALLELADQSGQALYRNQAARMLNNLTRDYRADSHNRYFILDHSVGSIPHGVEIDVPLVYADYYYLEALVRHRESQGR